MLIFILLGFILLCALFGWLYEQNAEAADRRRYPPPGKRIDVGGYRLHIVVRGERRPGQPTVVLESGDGLWSSCWQPVIHEITPFARVCAYDRPGFGWSEASPAACTLESIAADLHTLLQNAGETGPYLLVGHSYGGMMIRQFAAQYPREVSGLVFVDAIHENFIRYMPETRKSVPAFQFALRLLSFLAHFGLARLAFRRLVLSRFVSIFPKAEDQAMAAALTLHPAYFERLLAENIAGNRAMDHRLPDSVGNIPVIVLHAHYPETPGRSFTPERWKVFRECWMALEKDLLTLSENSELIAFEGGHIVQNEHPELIVNSVRRMIDK